MIRRTSDHQRTDRKDDARNCPSRLLSNEGLGVGNVSSGLTEAFAGVVSIFVVDCVGPVTVNGR